MSQENVEIVRRFYDAFNRGNPEALIALAAPDIEWRPALIGGGIVEGAIYYGHEGLIDFLKMQDETWETVTATPAVIQGVGQCVLAEVRLAAVGRTSGVPVQRTTWTVWELRDGRVSHGRVYIEKADALKAARLSE